MNPKPTYNSIYKVSSICMILMLLWLTVSAPFVFAAQQELAKQELKSGSATPLTATDDESTNPYGNNTEEKAPSSSAFSEEFIHDNEKAELFSSLIFRTHALENADTYHAFHGEQLVPPPDAA